MKPQLFNFVLLLVFEKKGFWAVKMIRSIVVVILFLINALKTTFAHQPTTLDHKSPIFY
ncbi:hypothetical protein SCB49_13750 [unidentified eubacterium SCB49]|nr:hypothetical protein SCB49_13750 [unidentified eubacterium SCB49]